LRKLMEYRGYRDSQQVLGLIRSATTVGEAAEIIIVIWRCPVVIIKLHTNKRERGV